MRTRNLVLLFVVLLAGPLAARAAQSTWELAGHLTTSSGDLVTFQPNEPFRVLASFDAAAIPVATQTFAQGARYDYPGSSLAFTLFMGSRDPSRVQFDSGPGGDGGIFLRDNAPFPPPNGPLADGYSFFLTSFDANGGGVITSILLIMRGPTLDIVNGPGLAPTPDPRLAGLPEAYLQVCRSSQASPGSCDIGFVEGKIESVSNPSYGTGYLFSARDCRVEQTASIGIDPFPFDCYNVNRATWQSWTFPAQFVNGGGLGFGAFSQTLAPVDTDIDAMWGTTRHASLGLPSASLGSLFGSVSFGGPVALPIVKGSTSPSDISRANTNLFAYQKYQYSGSGTQLPLVIDLTYNIGDYNVYIPTPDNQIGLRPGGAEIGVVMSIIDGSVSMDRVGAAGNNGFNSLTCGSEPLIGWPAGSILGTATFLNPEHEVGPQAVMRAAESCATPGQPVQLVAGQSFIVATSMQAPARGKAAQPSSTVGALTNGFVDAAHTMRVTFSPNAPPQLVQALADSITPACTGCGFTPDVLPIAINVNPGESKKDACISLRGKGEIRVALLGSAGFKVRDVRLDSSLRLGTLTAPLEKGRAECSVSRAKGGAYEDLVCEFENAPGTWQAGQTTATLTGKLFNGVPIQGSDSICLTK